MKLCRVVCLLAFVFVMTGICAFSFALEIDGETAGFYCWPEDCSEENARYVYRYSYPHAAGDEEPAITINAAINYMIEDAGSFAVPMTGETLPEDQNGETIVSSRITCLSDDFLSVLVVNKTIVGDDCTEIWSSLVFSLQGARAGTATSLPRVLGILKDEETDEWMLDRQKNKADELVRSLVWKCIQEKLSEGIIDFDPEMDYELYEANFYPEEDFYIDQDNRLVFYIQAGFLSDPADGTLLFPFDLEQLQDEL